MNNHFYTGMWNICTNTHTPKLIQKHTNTHIFATHIPTHKYPHTQIQNTKTLFYTLFASFYTHVNTLTLKYTQTHTQIPTHSHRFQTFVSF